VKGNLIMVNPLENVIVESLMLDGKLTDSSTYTIINDKLYTVAFENKTDSPIVNCITLARD
jgi:hypothetical protein